MFRLAHISDLHIGPLPPVAAPALLGQRLLGYLSWRWRRHRVYRPEVLEALRRDLQAERPDHVAITGDLVNIALPAEFDQAAAWLRALGPPQWISVVPGNHEAYVRIPCDQSLARWSDYMASDPGPSTSLDEAGCRFPYLRRVGWGRHSSRRWIACSRTLRMRGVAGWCSCITRRWPPSARGAGG